MAETSAISLGSECGFAAPPPKEGSFGDLMLTAELSRSFLGALYLAAQVELELPRESTRRFSGHILLRFGSEPAGVVSTQWYGRRGSLQGHRPLRQ